MSILKKLLPVSLILLPFFAHAQLNVVQGGTGLSSVTQNYVLLGNSQLHLQAVATSSLNITAASSTLLQDNNNFTGNNLFANATTTNLFSTTASSTNLYSTLGTFGTLITDIGHANGNWGVGKLVPTSGNLLIDSNGSGNAMTFSINGTEEARFSGSNGDLGIGLTAPLTILQVNDPFTSIGTNYPIVTFNNAVVGATMGGLYATTDNNTPPISAGLAFETYKQNVGLIEAGRFTSAGIFQPNNGFISGASSTNMGDFTVSGNFAGAGLSTCSSSNKGLSWSAGQFGCQTYTFASSTLLSDNNDFTGNNVFANATTTNLFSTTASSTRLFSSLLTVGGTGLVVDSARDVSIGATTDGGERLGVYSNQTQSTFNGGDTMRLQNAQGSGNWNTLHFAGAVSDGFIGYLDSATAATRDFVISSSANEDFNVLGNGNVGIGISNPANTLEISTTTALRSDMFSLNQSSGGRGLIAGVGASSAYFYINSGNSKDEIVGDNGTVGINLTKGSTPVSTLEVDGAETISAANARLYLNRASTGGSNYSILSLETAGTDKWDFGIDGDLSDSLLSLYNRASGHYDLRVSASDLFEVDGTQRVSATGQTGITVDLVPSSSSGGTAEIFANNYSGVGNLQISAGGINPQLFLDKGGVDVAVGTTTPNITGDAALTVSGGAGTNVVGSIELDGNRSGSGSRDASIWATNNYNSIARIDFTKDGTDANSGQIQFVTYNAGTPTTQAYFTKQGFFGVGVTPINTFDVKPSSAGAETAAVYTDTAGRGLELRTNDYVGGSTGSILDWQMHSGTGNVGSFFQTGQAGGSNDNGYISLEGYGGAGVIIGGDSSPAQELSVIGSIRQTGCTSVGTLSANGSGDIICTVSSEKDKNHIATSTEGLATVLAATPVSFYYNANMNMGTAQHLGFRAEQFLTLDPRLVTTDSKTGTVTGFDYNGYTAVLTKAIQEQQKEIDALKAPIVNVAHDAEDKWQDMFLALLVLWNLYLTFRKRK